MSSAYQCPNCKTNRTRFNIVEQHPKIVRMDAATGNIIEEYTAENKDPFHLPYRGPTIKIQCGICGVLEDEEMFIKYATYSQGKENT